LPEWRRSGPFFLIAVALHLVAALVWLRTPAVAAMPPPLQVLLDIRQPPPAAPQAVSAPPPAPVKPAPPKPARRPPVLAMSAEQQPPTPATFFVAAPPEPEAEPAPAAAAPIAAGPATPAAGPSLVAARYDAAYLNNPKPEYPSWSRQLGEQGKVSLRVRITADGLPASVELEKSSGFFRLDQAALRIVPRWRFVPARLGDQAIETTGNVVINFNLLDAQ
jgi:protein TonB